MKIPALLAAVVIALSIDSRAAEIAVELTPTEILYANTIRSLNYENYGFPLSRDGNAWLTAGRVISGRSLKELADFYGSVYDLLPEADRLHAAAPLAAAAAISKRSAKDLVTLFRELEEPARTAGIYGRAMLAFSAALSGRKSADMTRVFEYSFSSSLDRTGSAVIAAGAVIAKKEFTPQPIEIFDQLRGAPISNDSVEHASRATLAIAALITGRHPDQMLQFNEFTDNSILAFAAAYSFPSKQAADLLRQLKNPAQAPSLGQLNSAEETFQLNWNGAGLP